jgi:hypothetical protein
MTREIFGNTPSDGQTSAIVELEKMCQWFVDNGSGKITHNTTKENERIQYIEHGIGAFATKRFEIYDYGVWSIFEPFEDPRKVIDIKFWYSYKLQRMGVRMSKKDVIMFTKMVIEIIKRFKNSNGIEKINTEQVFIALNKLLVTSELIPVIPDADQI